MVNADTLVNIHKNLSNGQKHRMALSSPHFFTRFDPPPVPSEGPDNSSIATLQPKTIEPQQNMEEFKNKRIVLYWC